MDAIDKKIIGVLKDNGRATNKKVAKMLGISEGTVRNRIGKLLERHVIKRFTVDLSTSRGFMAFVLIESDPQRPTGTIVRRMSRFSEVLAVYETAGKWDVVVKVDTESPERFNDVIESIRLVNGVIDTETITVLKIS